MALLNKLGEIVKSAAEKTEELTKTLGEKASCPRNPAPELSSQ